MTMKLPKNLMLFLQDTRRRNIAFLTVFLLGCMLLIGIIKLFSRTNQPFNAFTKIRSIEDMSAIPGGTNQSSLAQHAVLQKKQNQENADYAKKTGRSAISTIVDSFQLNQEGVQDTNNIQATVNPYSQDTQLEHNTSFIPSVDQSNPFYQQQHEINKQQMQGAMQEQMHQLLSLWSHHPNQTSVKTTQPNQSRAQADKEASTALVKAGSIINAVLITAINSDESSAILARITEGYLKDARLIGTLSKAGDRVIVQFNTLNAPQFEKSIPIQAVAVDSHTARSTLSSYTDHHTILRYGSLFAGAFLENYSFAIQRAGNGLDLLGQSLLNPVGKSINALGNVGSQVSGVLVNQFKKDSTVYVNASTGIGVLFMNDLFIPSQTE